MQQCKAAPRPWAQGAGVTPEWGDLKVLLALARAGSMAGAARELQVDNSTVSRRLTALEDAVDAKLLIRGRELTWTCEGRAVLEAAEAMETSLASALRTVRASKVDVQGSVRVSVAPAFVPPLMRHALPAVRQAHPRLSVELRGSFQRADLAKGEVDIAVRMARPEEGDLIARRGFECVWFAYAAESYLQARGRPSKPAELAGHDLVLYAETLHSAPPARWMEAYKGAAAMVSRMDSIETTLHAILTGGGIAVLPAFVADGEAGLQRVFVESVASNTGWIVYHESARDTARVRLVADALVEFFQTHEALFTGTAAQ